MTTRLPLPTFTSVLTAPSTSTASIAPLASTFSRRTVRLLPFGSVTLPLARHWQVVAAVVSLVGMLILITVQVVTDVRTIARTSLAERWSDNTLTAVELLVCWGLLGAVFYAFRPARRA